MIKYTTFIGVDPGRSGAMAMLFKAPGNAIVNLFDNDDASFARIRNIVDRAKFLFDLSSDIRTVAVVEAPTPVPKQGVATVARFYKEIGWWEATLYYAGFSVARVRPQDWKRAISFATNSTGRGTLDKAQSRKIAESLYPDVNLGNKSDQGRSEALLIAHYAMISTKDLAFI